MEKNISEEEKEEEKNCTKIIQKTKQNKTLSNNKKFKPIFDVITFIFEFARYFESIDWDAIIDANMYEPNFQKICSMSRLGDLILWNGNLIIAFDSLEIKNKDFIEHAKHPMLDYTSPWLLK